jgi:hypothetical protein
MKRNLLLFLILNLLFSVFPSRLSESLCKVKRLLEHYQQHRETAAEYSFLQFLYTHYGDDQHVEEDVTKHHNLPIHHHHQEDCCHVVAQSPFFLPQQLPFFHFPTQPIVSCKLIAEPQQWNSAHYAGDIWQPPKG